MVSALGASSVGRHAKDVITREQVLGEKIIWPGGQGEASLAGDPHWRPKG